MCPAQHVPHAVFPMGSWLSFPLCGVPLTGACPSMLLLEGSLSCMLAATALSTPPLCAGIPGPMMGLVATVLLKLPLFKHVFAWMGCYPAGDASAQICCMVCKSL